MGVRIGFDFVPLPVSIWDEGIDLSLSEFRLLGYLIRRQVRFGEAVKGFTFDDLMDGPDRNGERLDKGCGLSRNGLLKALDALQKRGWISVEDTSTHPKLKQLRIRVLLVSQSDSDRHERVIGLPSKVDPFYKEESKKEEGKKEKGADAPHEETPTPKSSSSKTSKTLPLEMKEYAEAWAAFVAMRDRQRKPLTPRAVQLIQAKLARLQEAGNDPSAVLDQSTCNGWTDVYALKDEQANFGGSYGAGAGRPNLVNTLADARRILDAGRTGAGPGAGELLPHGAGGNGSVSRSQTGRAIHRTLLTPISPRAAP